MNAVLFGNTNLEAKELLKFLLETELKLGRIRNTSKGHVSRVIDLDLLMFNQLISTENDLILPHPRMHERIFVLKPLMDLKPDLEIPGLSNNVQHFYQILLSVKC
jgi:2-amino-4-hydroxy-6-hydroxymethyldihydropteridine diphosphokinase